MPTVALAPAATWTRSKPANDLRGHPRCNAREFRSTFTNTSTTASASLAPVLVTLTCTASLPAARAAAPMLCAGALAQLYEKLV